MKKNLATAMAAAMAFGTVAPAFANTVEVSTKALPGAVDGKIAVDVRTSQGEKTPRVVKRTDIYNTNNTTDRKDDTLKTEYKEVKILAEKQNKDNSYEDKFVIVEKLEETSANTAAINDAKANIATAKQLIEDAKKVEGTNLEKKEIAATFDGENYIQGKVEVTVTTKEGTKTVYAFNGVDGLAEDTTVTVEKLQKIFTDLNDKLTTDVVIDSSTTVATLTLDLDAKASSAATSYADLNRVKYTIEKNINEFDVVKDEVGTNNENLKVTLNKKGSKDKVMELTLQNVAKVDKSLVKNIPAKTDFTGHWAEEEIVEAMLNGHVDATGAFRAKDSITRAEFAKIVCTVFGIEITDEAVKGLEEPFTDVKKGDWYYNAITALYNTTSTTAEKGAIVGGYEDETFKPKSNITRQEAAKMVAAAYEITGKGGLHVAYDKEIEANEFTSSQATAKAENDGIVDVVAEIAGQKIHRDIITKFADDKDIAAWADEAVVALSNKNVINGNPDKTFKPKSEISRVEALLMITRAN